MTISHLVHRRAALETEAAETEAAETEAAETEAAVKEFEMSTAASTAMSTTMSTAATTAATTAAVKKPRKMAQARSKKNTMPMDVTNDDRSVSAASAVHGPEKAELKSTAAAAAAAAAIPATAKESQKKKIDVHNYTEEPWTVINSYFRGLHIKRLTEHQIESYNDFVNYQIQKTIAMFNPVHIRSEQDLMPAVGKYALEMYVTCENFNLYRPQIHENTGATKLMFPHEARLRNFTYSSNMTVDLNIKYVVRSGPLLESEQVIYKVLPNIQIGKLPVMLKSSVCILEQHKHISPAVSGECRMDPGGYFIINGSEKTVLAQERARENKPAWGKNAPPKISCNALTSPRTQPSGVLLPKSSLCPTTSVFLPSKLP